MPVIIDCEIYSNYFLLAAKFTDTGQVAYFQIYNTDPAMEHYIRTLMETQTTISFNGFNFDLPLIQAALEGYPVENLKKLANKIIKTKGGNWKVLRDENIHIPTEWDHIDLIDVAPGQASLKIYGGRMHMPRLQDLPLEPDRVLTKAEMEEIKTYCVNDLDTTEALYNKLLPQIQLRESMSEQYGMDLRSKSDAQIAETVIKSGLHKITGKTYVKPKLKDNVTFKYRDPKIIKFKDPQLTEIFTHLLEHDFEVAGNGSVKMPTWLKDSKIKIGNAEYQMGIGGLHSCEKSQLVRADDGCYVLELDVSSYYPNLILQQQLSPKSLGVEFLKLYQSLVTRRLEAKTLGDKVTADTYKIVLNSSFGKLGSKYSPLYAPELLIQTTITGQLALLMLIERMEAEGIEIKSANTDGIVCKCSKARERSLEVVAWEWMLQTSFNLERTDYRLLASRDVNNYLAVKPDGKTKGKGCFANGSLMKNPNRNVIYIAVAEFLKSGKPISETIEECNDIRQFVTVRHVQGGAIYNGEKLGKAVRFYSSNEIMPADHCLHYKLNNNKVPGSSGCKPAMTFSEDYSLPDDLDYGAYITDVEALLKEVGYD